MWYILCLHVSPTPDCNQKVSWGFRWEFKYLVGYLSNRHMIRYGVYHIFVPAYSASQILCSVLSCGIRVASMSNVVSLPLSKRCSHISMWILIHHDNRGRHVNSFPTGVLLFKWIRSFQHSRDQFSVLCNGVCFIRPKLSLFSRPPTLSVQASWGLICALFALTRCATRTRYTWGLL